jgi:hypothetical protein
MLFTQKIFISPSPSQYTFILCFINNSCLGKIATGKARYLLNIVY